MFFVQGQKSEDRTCAEVKVCWVEAEVFKLVVLKVGDEDFVIVQVIDELFEVSWKITKNSYLPLSNIVYHDGINILTALAYRPSANHLNW